MKKKISVLLTLLVSLSVLQSKPSIAKQNQLAFLMLNKIQNVEKACVDIKKTITFNFDKDDLVIKREHEGISYSLPNCSGSNITGKPDLPVFKEYMPLNKTEEVSYIRTVSISGEKLTCSNTPLALVQPPKMYNDYPNTKDTFTSINKASKRSILPEDFKETYPLINVQSKVYSLDGQKNLSLIVHPIYIHEGCLYFLTSITIEIGFNKNLQMLDSVDEKTNSSVILSPDEFKEAANELAEIQKSSGYDIEVVFISDIKKLKQADFPKPLARGYSKEVAEEGKYESFLEDYDYELSAKIRTMLESRLAEDKIDYLTILGDASWVPPSFYYFAWTFQSNSYVDACVPTDFYYMAPLAAQGDMDFDISIGRIPVQSIEDANNAVEKIRKYRKSLSENKEWLNNVSLFSGDPFDGNYFAELCQSQALNKNLFNGLNIKKFFQTDGLFNKKECEKELFLSGNRILWITGHGSGSKLYLGNEYIDTEDILKADEQENLPIIISESCLNGTWDSRLINGMEDTPSLSFSESIFKSKGAGIAYIGGSRSNYSYVRVEYDNGVPNLIDPTFVNSVTEYTTDFIVNNFESTLGDGVKKALAKYYSNDVLIDRTHYEDSENLLYAPDVKALFGFCLLGDPTLPSIKTQKQKEYSVPEVDELKDCRESASFIPMFSIDDGQKVNVETNSISLKYIYASYENKENGFISSGMMEEDEDDYVKNFQKFVKSKCCIRFETDDKKETRVVFFAKNNHDVAVKKCSPTLSILEKGESVKNGIEIVNEGIYDSGKIEVEVSKNDAVFEKFQVESLPYNNSATYNYELNNVEESEIEITASVKLIEQKDTFLENDSFVDNILVPNDTVLRIGMLITPWYRSPYFVQDIGNNVLEFEKMNELFKDEKLNVEIKTVSYYINEKGEVSFDFLGFDALLLYDGLWTTYPSSLLYRDLEKFTDNGGKILGVLALNNEMIEDGDLVTEMQKLFGIKPEVNISIKVTKQETTVLTVTDESIGLQKKQYKINNRIALYPRSKSEENRSVKWSEEHLLEDASIAASSDGATCYIKYKNNTFFYTGFFSYRSFKKNPETFVFFKDLLCSLMTNEKQIETKKVIKRENHSSKESNSRYQKQFISRKLKDPLPKEEIEEVFSYQKDKNYFIIDFKVNEEGIFIATPFGIKLYKDEELIEEIPYPDELYMAFGSVTQTLAGADLSFLDVTEKYISIHMGSDIYILDRKTYKKVQTIHQADFSNPLIEEYNYFRIVDVAICGDYLFVTSIFYFLKFDIKSGKLLSKVEMHMNYPRMHVFNDEYIFIDNFDIVIYHIPSNQIKEVDFYVGMYRHYMFQNDPESISVLFYFEKEYFIHNFSFNELWENDHIECDGRSEFKKFRNVNSNIVTIQKYEDIYALSYNERVLDDPTFVHYSSLKKLNNKNGNLRRTLFLKDIKSIKKGKYQIPLSSCVKIIPDSNRYYSAIDTYKSSIYYRWRYLDKCQEFVVKDIETDVYETINQNDFDGLYSHHIETVNNGKWTDVYSSEEELGFITFDLTSELSKIGKNQNVLLEYDEDNPFRAHSIDNSGEYFCLYESTHDSIIWYDKKTGEQIKRQYFSESDYYESKERYPMYIKEMVSENNTVYLLDIFNNCIHSCNIETGFGDKIKVDDCFPFLQYRNIVVQNGVIFILDANSSRIKVFKNNRLIKVIEPQELNAESIVSFDICDGKILINDVKKGMVYVQPFNTKEIAGTLK